MTDGGKGPVIREDDGGVAALWLIRGERNELDTGLLDALAEALADCEADPSVRAIVLTGVGSSFCAGIDLSSGPTAIRDLLLGEGGGRVGYQEPAGRITCGCGNPAAARGGRWAGPSRHRGRRKPCDRGARRDAGLCGRCRGVPGAQTARVRRPSRLGRG